MKSTIISNGNYMKRCEPLGKTEILALRKKNVGYGNLIGNARKAGIHENTYRYILDRGYGTPEMVHRIRKMLKAKT